MAFVGKERKILLGEINNKIFVCANTKELGWFIGNFLLYCLRNNLKSFYYAPKTYFKELFNVIYNLSNITF